VAILAPNVVARISRHGNQVARVEREHAILAALASGITRYGTLRPGLARGHSSIPADVCQLAAPGTSLLAQLAHREARTRHDKLRFARSEENAVRPANLLSTRIATLRRRLDAGDLGAVEEFWRDVAAEGTPLIALS